MGTNINDVYYCQMNRNTELSNRMYKRNIPSHQMGQSYFARPIDTYATEMQIMDCRKQTTVAKAEFPPYNQKAVFNPGQSAPFEGYRNTIDIESKLYNMYHPIQKCVQGKYIPSSHSEIYNSPNITTSNPVKMSHGLLFKKENFKPFNPNQCNLGYKIFANDTRQQIKNIKLNNGSTEY